MLNAHIAHSKFTIRSRRWYIILFWHFITLALTNAWQVYRPKRDWEILNITQVYLLRQFQALVAQRLVEVSMGLVKKRGRPTLESSKSPCSTRRVRTAPSDNGRYDSIGHWPKREKMRRRCAVCKCLKTVTYCEKCNVPICFTENRNCCREYHFK